MAGEFWENLTVIAPLRDRIVCFDVFSVGQPDVEAANKLRAAIAEESARLIGMDNLSVLDREESQKAFPMLTEVRRVIEEILEDFNPWAKKQKAIQSRPRGTSFHYDLNRNAIYEKESDLWGKVFWGVAAIFPLDDKGTLIAPNLTIAMRSKVNPTSPVVDSRPAAEVSQQTEVQQADPDMVLLVCSTAAHASAEVPGVRSVILGAQGRMEPLNNETLELLGGRIGLNKQRQKVVMLPEGSRFKARRPLLHSSIRVEGLTAPPPLTLVKSRPNTL